MNNVERFSAAYIFQYQLLLLFVDALQNAAIYYGWHEIYWIKNSANIHILWHYSAIIHSKREQEKERYEGSSGLQMNTFKKYARIIVKTKYLN